jgi:hypothetical protein
MNKINSFDSFNKNYNIFESSNISFESKNYIKEAHGVPSGILEGARKIYNYILEELEKVYDATKRSDSFEFKPKIHFEDIGGKPVLENLIIFFYYQTNTDITKDQARLRLAGGMDRKKKIGKDMKLRIDQNKEPILTLSLVLTESNDLINEMVDQKDVLISLIGHEIKHSYDEFMTADSLESSAKYSAIKQTMAFSGGELKNFLFLVYYSCAVENSVRAVEFAAKLSDVSKKDFYEFLQSDNTYEMVKKLRNWSFDGMVEKMQKSNSEFTTKEKVIKVLKKFLQSYREISLDKAGSILGDLSREQIDIIRQIPDSMERQSKWEENINQFDSYMYALKKKLKSETQNPEIFFRRMDKWFKQTAEKLLRKIVNMLH